jgi:hypothetical protein
MREESGEKAEEEKKKEEKKEPDLLRVVIVLAWGAAVLCPYMNMNMNLPRRLDCVNTLG